MCIRDSGYGPASGLIFQSGWLYGTTEEGGTYDLGTVFQLVPGTKNGTWTETVLHSFNNTGEDGNSPTGSLISAGGKLYGTTQAVSYTHLDVYKRQVYYQLLGNIQSMFT